MDLSARYLRQTPRHASLHASAGGSVVPPSFAQRLLTEVLLWFSAVVLLAAAVALLSYHSGDAAWSNSGGLAGSASNLSNTPKTHNWLGTWGAGFADAAFFALGRSFWWVWLSFVVLWAAYFGRLRRSTKPVVQSKTQAAPQARFGAVVGHTHSVTPADQGSALAQTLDRGKWYFVAVSAAMGVLLAASCALEWAYLSGWDYQNTTQAAAAGRSALPANSGGWLGYWAGSLSYAGWFGRGWHAVLPTLGWLALLLWALPWVFGFSWLRTTEGLGAWLWQRYERLRYAKELEEDLKLGAAAAAERARQLQPEGDGAYGMGTTGTALWPSDAPHPALRQTAENAPAASRIEPELGDALELAATADLPTAHNGTDTDTGTDTENTQTSYARTDSIFGTSALEEPTSVLTHPSPIQAYSPATAAKSNRPAAAAREFTKPAAAEAESKRLLAERQSNLFGATTSLPQVSLLDAKTLHQETVSEEMLEMTARLIEKKLADFGVKVRVVAAMPGPVVTRYEIEPAVGVKGSQVVNLAKDLARSLSLVSVRVIETIPGKNFMALELPNARRQTIKLSEVLGSAAYNDSKSLLTMGLGKDIVGKAVVADLAKMPHCLVAGTTGSGKSVGINAMILSLLYKAEPADVRLLLIDPKMLEMSVYEGIGHLLCPVVTDMKQAAYGLNWCVGEMERRYKLMSKLGVRNLAGYNTKVLDAQARGEWINNPFSISPENPEPLEKLPHIVVVIDELADLMMVVGKKIEELIARLAQKARAAGIHLILATQRPSVDVITGLIKANIPTRLSFQVSSKIDSRTILDQMGAESLLGMGDMLYLPSGTGFPIRVHGAFVSDDEVHRVVEYLKSVGEPDYIEGVLDGEEDGENADPAGAEADANASLYDRAVAVVLAAQTPSISFVQRKLGIGYNKSANLLEQMEQAGIVSAMGRSGKREILVPVNQG